MYSADQDILFDTFLRLRMVAFGWGFFGTLPIAVFYFHNCDREVRNSADPKGDECVEDEKAQVQLEDS